MKPHLHGRPVPELVKRHEQAMADQQDQGGTLTGAQLLARAWSTPPHLRVGETDRGR